MKKITIIHAKSADKSSILDFINNHWSKNHILTKKNNIFDYYYKEKKKINFLLAKDKSKIVGLLGFIKDEKYSKKPKSIVWTSILKSLENYPTTGILLVDKLINKFKGCDIGCMGNNIQSEKLFKLLGFSTKNLNHYYIINPKYNNFNLIKFEKRIKTHLVKKKPKIQLKYSLIHKGNVSKLPFFDFIGKNNYFLINKYIKNSFYNYKIFRIKNLENRIENMIVIRMIKTKKSKCIRVVDLFGNFKKIITVIYLFHELIKKYNAEYLDFYSSKKIPSSLLKYINKNSFKKKIIIPNYYEPFVQKNIKIRYGILFKKNKRNYVFFKSEGDSERPNII